MTREEAAEFTRKLVARAETIVFPKTVKTINNIPVFYFEAVLSALRGPQPDPKTGLAPCGCGEWIYTIEKGSCMDYHVTAKCSECGWDWFSKDGEGNFSAVFSAFITNGDSKRDEAERFLIENAKANNKLNYCPNCGAKMENKP